jgi:4-diphosphocytidyl-2-C-methyl-D-erythritol kinase
LRLIGQANQGADFDPAALAPALGSDVAGCLESRPALITGRGEAVTPVRGFPACGVVLVNPGVKLATAEVYSALNAPPLGAVPDDALPDFAGDLDTLIGYARARGNDLEPIAMRLAPQVGDVLAALAALDGARLARMSGSGATCFAMFATPRAALRAATVLAQSEPDWWITASMLGDPKSGQA